MEKALRDVKVILFFILPALIWYSLIAVIPVFQSLGLSFVSWTGLNRPRFTGLQNYITIFTDPYFYKAAVRSLYLAAASIFIQIPIAMILALILARGVRGEGIYRTVYFIPVVISSTIIAQLWMKIYHPNYGILNVFLKSIGLEFLQHAWLADTKIVLTAVIIPMIWQYIGYHMLLFYSALKSISADIKEAAVVDGASNIQLSFRILIPLITPMIQASVIFALIGSLKSFDMIYVLTNGGPLRATEVTTLLMYSEIFTAKRYGPGSAMAIFIIIECLIFTLIIQRIFNKFQTE
jgi:raffinose/stachyose/melibiose transport system permease protein